MSALGPLATILVMLGSVIVLLFAIMYSVSVARMLREVGSGKQRQELGISLMFYFGVGLFAISEALRSMAGKVNLGFPEATPEYLSLVALLVFAFSLYARMETAHDRYHIMSQIAKIQHKVDGTPTTKKR